MKLYIARHGDSLPKEIHPESPLSERGRQEVQRIAHFVSQFRPQVQDIFHSGKKRAQETAEILAAAFNNQGYLQARSDMNPMDFVDPLIKDLLEQEKTVLLVGHLPFMETLVSSLCCRTEKNSIVSLVAGSLLCLERKTGESLWTINWMINPEILVND